MRKRELIKYAKENGYNTVKFAIKKDGNIIATAQFLDAYYEFIKIPVCGDGFIILSDLEEMQGCDLDFDILNEEEYKAFTRISFLLRKMAVPKKYESEVEEDADEN